MPETLIIALLTICGSGVVSAYVTHKLNQNEAERRLRLEKLEKLHTCVYEYCRMMFALNASWLGVMKGDYDYNRGLDMIEETRTETDNEQFRGAEMLVSIYFPSLKIYWQRIIAHRDKINIAVGAFREDYKKNGPRPEHRQYMKPLSALLEGIDGVEEEFKQQLFSVAERYSEKRLLLPD